MPVAGEQAPLSQGSPIPCYRGRRVCGKRSPDPRASSRFSGRAAGAARGGDSASPARRLRTAGADPASRRGFMRAGRRAGACAVRGGALPGAERGQSRPRPPAPPTAPRCSRRFHACCSPPPVPPARLRTARVSQAGGAFLWDEMSSASASPETMPPPEKFTPRIRSEGKGAASLSALGKGWGRRAAAQLQGEPETTCTFLPEAPRHQLRSCFSVTKTLAHSGQGPTNVCPAFGTWGDGGYPYF